MALILCLIAIVLAIVGGYVFKINTGIIAMVFAFIIGVCVLNLSVTKIIGYWPVSIMFFLIAIALLFNYANETGTMDALGRKMLYAMGGKAKLLPWVFAIVAGVVAILGAGASTPGIIGPFAFVMGLFAGVDPVLIAIATLFGASMTMNNPINGYGGVISNQLIVANGTDAPVAWQMSLDLWANMAVACFIIILLFYIFKKGFKASQVTTIEKPEPFTTVQKKTLGVILVCVVFMFVPSMLNMLIPGVAFLKTFAALCQPQSVMIFGSLACCIMKLAPEKKIIASVPWKTIVMLSGVVMLINVAIQAGLVDTVGSILSSSVPAWLVAPLMCAFAGFLTFFSSMTAVVLPLMYPLVPGLAASLNLNPILLYTAVFLGGTSTAISPYSMAGSMLVGSCQDDDVREKLPDRFLVAALVCLAIAVVLSGIGIFNILTV